MIIYGTIKKDLFRKEGTTNGHDWILQKILIKQIGVDEGELEVVMWGTQAKEFTESYHIGDKIKLDIKLESKQSPKNENQYFTQVNVKAIMVDEVQTEEITSVAEQDFESQFVDNKKEDNSSGSDETDDLPF